MVHDTDIIELDLKSKRFQLSLKKKGAIEQPAPQVGLRCQFRARALALAQHPAQQLTKLRLSPSSQLR